MVSAELDLTNGMIREACLRKASIINSLRRVEVPFHLAHPRINIAPGAFIRGVKNEKVFTINRDGLIATPLRVYYRLKVMPGGETDSFVLTNSITIPEGDLKAVLPVNLHDLSRPKAELFDTVVTLLPAKASEDYIIGGMPSATIRVSAP
jgi:hypothetical protein